MTGRQRMLVAHFIAAAERRDRRFKWRVVEEVAGLPELEGQAGLDRRPIQDERAERRAG